MNKFQIGQRAGLTQLASSTADPPSNTGFSAKDSRIFFSSAVTCATLSGASSESTDWLSEQILRIELTPRVYERRYGHDKSYGWEDSCTGIKGMDINLTTRVGSSSTPLTASIGTVVFIQAYPLNSCATPLQGYGTIISDPIVCNLENGDPVEHNYRITSKGRWTGLPNDNDEWGGYECDCSGGSGSGRGTELAVPYSDGILVPQTAPMTVYQWNGTAWTQLYDEATGAYGTAPVPTTAGTYQGQMQFVPCVTSDTSGQ